MAGKSVSTPVLHARWRDPAILKRAALEVQGVRGKAHFKYSGKGKRRLGDA